MDGGAHPFLIMLSPGSPTSEAISRLFYLLFLAGLSLNKEKFSVALFFSMRFNRQSSMASNSSLSVRGHFSFWRWVQNSPRARVKFWTPVFQAPTPLFRLQWQPCSPIGFLDIESFFSSLQRLLGGHEST